MGTGAPGLIPQCLRVKWLSGSSRSDDKAFHADEKQGTWSFDPRLLLIEFRAPSQSQRAITYQLISPAQLIMAFGLMCQELTADRIHEVESRGRFRRSRSPASALEARGDHKS